jgi:hypothetical protein
MGVKDPALRVTPGIYFPESRAEGPRPVADATKDRTSLSWKFILEVNMGSPIEDTKTK